MKAEKISKMPEVSSNKSVFSCGKWITVQDIEELYGMHRKEAANKLGVSESTLRRKLRELGFPRWQYPKRKCNSFKFKSCVRVDVLQSSHDTSSQSNCEEKETHFEEETTEMGDESKSISTLSFSSIDNTKLHFDKLIASSLEDLSHPENESSMIKVLSILSDKPSLFSEEQAEQIDELLLDFPALVLNWKEYHSLFQTCNLKSLDETEETSVKDEERLKVRYEELKIKEKELMTQLAAVQKEKAGIAEQRTEKSKRIKELISSTEEKAAHRNKEECLMRIATTKLNNLSDQWAKLQSFFI